MMVRQADRLVANSQGVGDDLMRLARVPASKVVVINNPVAVDEIVAQSHAAERGCPLPAMPRSSWPRAAWRRRKTTHF